MGRWKNLVLIGLVSLACGGKPEQAPPAVNGRGAVTPPGVTSDDPRAALFLQKGCPQCHSISALGVKSPAEIGPDLTFAYSDVKNRFNEPLEQFLHNPTGTMQLVLGQMVQLSPEERDSIIHILKRLHEDLHQETP